MIGVTSSFAREMDARAVLAAAQSALLARDNVRLRWQMRMPSQLVVPPFVAAAGQPVDRGVFQGEVVLSAGRWRHELQVFEPDETGELRAYPSRL
ncbi:MAG: hypothetical protein ACPMAQ_16795 [Phycisphaerae bacterium]